MRTCALICVFIYLELTGKGFGDGNVSTATCHLMRLLVEEKRLIEALHTFILSEEKENSSVSSNVKTFFVEVNATNAAALLDEHHVEHPINAFHLIYRVGSKWLTTFNDLWWESVKDKNNAKVFNASLYEARNSGVWPGNEDMTGSAIAILRLWKTYKLDLLDLLSGKIHDWQTTCLSYDDVITICGCAMEKEMYYDVIIWLETYMKYMKIFSAENDTRILRVALMLANAYQKFEMPWKSVDVLQPLLVTGDYDIIAEHDFVKSISDLYGPENRTAQVEYTQEKTFEVYNALCRGDIKTPEEKSVLKCFLRKTKIPYYWSKEEVVNYTPRVSLFHDVISDKEIEYLRKEATSKLERSTVLASDGYTRLHHDFRISNTAWLNESHSDILQRLSKRVGIITGLNTRQTYEYSDVEQFQGVKVSHAGTFVFCPICILPSPRLYLPFKKKFTLKMDQVLNYGVGGMYRPHHDFVHSPLWESANKYPGNDIRSSGERIATWMFYLSDVRSGGATVFPKIRSRVPAVKGAAAFWYNVKPSGDPDHLTLHAGCPVLLGSKWVSNKWIREGGQVFNRLCGFSRISTDNQPMK